MCVHVCMYVCFLQAAVNALVERIKPCVPYVFTTIKIWVSIVYKRMCVYVCECVCTLTVILEKNSLKHYNAIKASATV